MKDSAEIIKTALSECELGLQDSFFGAFDLEKPLGIPLQFPNPGSSSLLHYSISEITAVIQKKTCSMT